MLSLALAVFASRAGAQEAEPAPKSDAMSTLAPDAHAPPVEGDRPVVPTDAAAWAGAMLIIIIAMFLMAAVIGPMVRMEMAANHQTEDPAAEDEPHPSHHGHSHGH
jgi:hypothetical protein